MYKRSCEDNITLNLRDVRFEDVKWTEANHYGGPQHNNITDGN